MTGTTRLPVKEAAILNGGMQPSGVAGHTRMSSFNRACDR